MERGIPSLRVEKPGKSKFEPFISGERRKAIVSQTSQIIPTIPVEIPLANTSLADGTFPTETVETNSLQHTRKRQTTTIEAVAARRERRRSIHAATVEEILPSAPQTAASLALKFTSGERHRITMAHFLRDTGVGVPMSQSADQTPRPTPKASKSTMIADRGAQSSVSTTILPQVRVVNDEIVVDEDIATFTADALLPTTDMEVINETGKNLTSHAFVKTIGNNRWSKEDTDKFYEALSMCGTDFAMISLLFPKRSREQVKGKYKVEEKNNPTKVSMFLRKTKPLNTEWFERAQKERQDYESGQQEREERKPGRPRQEGINGLLSSPTSSRPSTPTSSPKKTKLAAIPAEQDIFTSSPRKSPRIAARINKQ